MGLKEWYKEWFDSPYYHLLYHKRNEQEAYEFIDRLVARLNPIPGNFLLDAACGKGRHTKILADKGFDVTGIDISERSVCEAKKYESDTIHFFTHDMRLPFYINYFHYAFNFFTSFGYFGTQREHDDAIRTISQSLKLNGIFVIDYLNVHFAEDNLVKSEEIEIDDVIFYITRWHDEYHFYKQIQVVEKGHTRKHLFTEKVKKFSPGDFTDMLAYQDMQVQEILGDYHLNNFNIRKSPRMILVAKKIRH